MSITQKLSVTATLLAIVLLAIVVTSWQVTATRRARRAAKLEARTYARIVSAAAEAILQRDGNLQQLVELAEPKAGIGVTFYGVDARPVGSREDEASSAVVNRRIRRVIDRNSAEDAMFDTKTEQLYLLWVPLSYRRGIAGAVEIKLDIARYDLSLGGIDWLISGTLLLLFGILLWLYARYAIEKPIYRLLGGMDHVIAGDLTYTLPLERSDEIGRIGYRFHEMTSQLRTAQAAILNNASMRLKLEQQLRQSEKLATVGQLAAEVAHEVGNPLHVIAARASALARRPSPAPDVARNAQIIADQAQRITAIIHRLLDLARVHAPRTEPVNISDVITETTTLLDYQLAQASLKLRCNVPDTLPTICGDANQLQQVFLNLLLNAIHVSPNNGEIIIDASLQSRRKAGLSASPPEHFVCISVEDQGPGIPETQRSRVFEPFFSTKPAGEGTGLGLTVTQGIVRDHDGWIEVGDMQKSGTKIFVYLPTTASSTDASSEQGPSSNHLQQKSPNG